MKYINHMTRSAEDDKHDALRERHGLAGYGAYWLIAEKIGNQISPEQINVWMVRSWKKWAQILSISVKKSQNIIKTMNDLGLIRLHSDDVYAAIGMPNLLKYADEYIKKVLRDSGQTPESLGSLSSPPALPAFRKKKDLKPEPVDNVDNSPQSDGATPASGGVLEAPPAAAPPLLAGKPKGKNQPPAVDEVHRLGDLIKHKQDELGIKPRTAAEIISDTVLLEASRTVSTKTETVKT